MVANFYRHEFTQGDNYSVTIDLLNGATPIDTTGWSGASAIQTLDGNIPLDNSDAPIAFAVSFPTAGAVQFSLPATENKQLLPQRYLYDAKLVDASGNPQHYLTGDVIIRRSYTP